jgi:hypothetical protein
VNQHFGYPLRCGHLTNLTRNHRLAGYVHIVLKRELREKLDSLRVSTPTRLESYADVISRLVQERIGVNTRSKHAISKSKGVDTSKSSVNTQKPTRVSRESPKSPESLMGLSLEEAVELKLAGKI